MIICNPTHEESATLVKYYWIVQLCKIAKLQYQADYMATSTAQESIYIHKGCPDCQIYAPQDDQTFIETLR